MGQAATKYNAGEAFETAIGEILDGSFLIRIDSNLMAAHLAYIPPHGGVPVLMESVLQEAANLGITVQLNLEAIKKTLETGGENVLIASGTPPVNGIDGKVESLIPTMANRSPHLDEHGLADFRDLGEIVTVNVGDPLMRRTPATSGEQGLTVTGKSIPAKPGKEAVFATKMTGAVIDPKDPNLLIATISGYPVQKKGEVSVESTYKVKNVDLHTGNIIFDGMVHVIEDVHTGMTIKATGDIHVNGTVEGATLEAGGDIVVKGGILGDSSQDGNSKYAIKCGGSCTARFVQNAHISAGQGIFIHDFTMQSELFAGHQIIVGDKGSRKGNIIGGTARAAMLVKAQTLGSDSYIKTVIIAGADQSLHDRMNAAIKAREEAEHKLADIIKLLELAHQNPGRIPPAAVKSAESTREVTHSEIATLRDNEMELQAEIDLVNEAQVVVEKQIFGGVEVHFGIKCQRIVSDREGGTFHLKDGELIFV
jgi:hypothetical protein